MSLEFAIEMKRLELETKKLDVEADVLLDQIEGKVRNRERKEIGYCLECVIKHLSAAVKYAEEAIDYKRQGRDISPFMKNIVKELEGMRGDITDDAPEEVLYIRDRARMIRIAMTRTYMLVGVTTLKDLQDLRNELDKLLDKAIDIQRKMVKKAGDLTIEIARALQSL
ncbi:MAG: hypothetical protein DRJ41_04920 [Thermoprotei archaeon]|nr:MAG: hypothetical protein DRJ41_04920 [Thermoprotei archaeon]